MIVLELEPGKGFGPVKLGSSREEARAAMAAIGFPLESSRADSDHFCKSSIETECDKDGRVMFIGVWCSRAFVAREVWGQVGLGNEAYVSVIKAVEDDA